MRTQVAIIGAGPSGLLLAQLLYLAGIESVALERRGREYVEARIRAGVLEKGTVDLLDRARVSQRLHAEGLQHDGFNIAIDGVLFRINLFELTGGSRVMVYGQTEITRDLNETIIGRNGRLIFDTEEVEIHDVDSKAPFVTYKHEDAKHRLDCDFIAGCDGYHGVTRTSIPDSVLTTFEKIYPFGWLGILANVPPCNTELIYSNHERGFALASMRSGTRSRYYIQCPINEDIGNWPDERIWDELSIRLGPDASSRMMRAPSIEKSITPLRSFVVEPMRFGRLFLVGDAAHIVPPAGAKGLNLAASDARFLSEALIEFYRSGSEAGLETYSKKALARVWNAERFSSWFTGLTHLFLNVPPIDRKLQLAELGYIRSSRIAQMVVAENYVGLPF